MTTSYNPWVDLALSAKSDDSWADKEPEKEAGALELAGKKKVNDDNDDAEEDDDDEEEDRLEELRKEEEDDNDFEDDDDDDEDGKLKASLDNKFGLTTGVLAAELGGKKKNAKELNLSVEKAKCEHMNEDGTFAGGFSGCVLHMTSKCGGSKSEESAKAICGGIAQNKKPLEASLGLAPGSLSIELAGNPNH